MSEGNDSQRLADLARRIEAGDHDAEGQLVEVLGRGVSFVLRRLISDPELAQDLYQETFRVVLINLRRGDLKDPTKVAAFVRGTATNLARNEWRKKSRRGAHEDVEAMPLPDVRPGPLQKAVTEEERRGVLRVLSELGSDRDRQILFQHYLAENDKEEICHSLNIEASQFALVLFRARKRFQKLMESAERRRNMFQMLPGGKNE